ncbi:MAG TPA: Fur family transcriptional regulator [Chiayiivirga sp.]|jgi:Fur family zinc uptake transcriptional regulator|uniref:Fur family transcriptional regulator n=1 Tax=Denitratimonas tolerans TaxID=1338420 RepID=A0AAW9R7R0_9GAMM|nr:transcriptional repressor [Xanthomonadaceae bacterium]MDX9763592.1 Fur family transcriptional regulator [Chiayiivirga sp.]MEB2314645.1 Fur family transcriptional regulator [Xanthomonadaceae bacterium]HRN59835.1 Fur family transcriptional regulator [Chiayiivirga sp.]HRO88074.1 Fur family transcriptional regulator [Chiayiivirga sp.]
MAPIPHQRCVHPDDHVHDRDAFVREVMDVCDERGLRLTPLRERVLRLVAQAELPVKAYDLMDQLRDDRGPAAPPTVYRVLDFLLENGFIHKLESINAYVGCHQPRQRHSVPFLICEGCGRAVEMEDERATRLLTEQAYALGFRPLAQTLEVHGRCARCAESE